jgi:hypothetical protein
VQPLPLLIVVAVVTCAAVILAVRFAIRAKRQADEAGQFVLGLSAAANGPSVAISASSEAADSAKRKAKRSKRDDATPVFDERQVDETIHRFILSN